MEIDHFLHVSMEIGLLLNTLIHLLEKRLVDKLLDAAHGEMRHEILSVAEITQAIKGIKDVLFQIVKCLGLVFHTKPEHSRRMVATEDARAVEVHGERLVSFCYLLASLDDLGDILVGSVAHELQGKMDLVGLAPIDVAALMFQISLKSLHQCRILRPNLNRYR